MNKELHLATSISLESGHTATGFTIKNGRIQIVDKNGNFVAPISTNRIVFTERNKGPKVRSMVTLENACTSLDGIIDWTHFDSVIVIDTNKAELDGKAVAVGAFMHLRFSGWHDGVLVELVAKQLNYIELTPCLGNPELQAILRVAEAVSTWADFNPDGNVAIVTDTELGGHQAINERQASLFGPYMLPLGFSLHYAGADSAQETISRLMKMCDEFAKAWSKKLANAEPKFTVPESILPEDSRIRFRFRNVGMEIEQPFVRGLSFGPNSPIRVYGIPKDMEERDLVTRLKDLQTAPKV
ncbi:hypothetical protein NHH82_21455 [Oxalobacteraceae bacterium OTU3REALA1]|nr:hypothetical protein NHH82_21455 [Oxalobacteraceae bacterium OTU3REALA1]